MAAVLTDPERKLLTRTFLFCNLSQPELTDVLVRPACHRASFAKGSVIYSPHAFERSLGVLLTGAVEVTKRELIISVLREGELFGAAALFNDEEDYATTLTARAPCDIVFFPQALVAELMEQYPALTKAYVRYLSGRIRFLSGKIEGLIAGDAERRLEQYLLTRLEGDKVALDCSATALARRLNMSRASLYRAFETLEGSGKIQREGKTITLNGEMERN